MISTTKAITIALCLGAVPALAVAAPGTQPQEQPQEQPPGQDPGQQQPGQEQQPGMEPGTPGGEQGEQGQQGQQTQGQQMQGEQKAQAEASILSAMFGIETGETAASLFHQIATTDAKMSRDTKKVADVAVDAVDAAKRNLEQLGKMEQLPEQQKNEAKRAMQKLDEAHATVRDIEKQVGKLGKGDEQVGQKLQQNAMELHAQLGEAKQVVETIAQANGISTDLQMPERAAARTQ